MSLPLDTPRLLIDGVEVNPKMVWIHQQSDPHPGGHRYQLLLPAPLVDKFPPGKRRDLNWVDGALGVARWEQGARVEAPATFVLNTIDRFHQSPEGIDIEGECSPQCSTLRAPCCGATVWANWLFDHCVPEGDGKLLFRCKECSAVSSVTLRGEDLSMSLQDGTRVSHCRQTALRHRFAACVLTIELGKLKWTFPDG